MSKDSGKPLTHLGIQSSDLPDRVLVVGDPARAQAAALMLDAYVEVGRNREYVTYRGNHGSVPVAVVSHGVGAAGSEKRGEGGKVVRKVGIPCGRCRKKSKKHAARAPVGEGGGGDRKSVV